MISAGSEAEVEQYWNEFQQYAKDAGIEAIEKKMTERYVQNLKIYQDNGYFTDIVVE